MPRTSRLVEELVERRSGNDEAANNVDLELVACRAEKLMQDAEQSQTFVDDAAYAAFRAELYSRMYAAEFKKAKRQ